MMPQNRRLLPQRDRSAEFIVTFASCNNASLQGVLEHSSSRRTQVFRSFFEMLVLIEAVLAETGVPQPVTKRRHWYSGKNVDSDKKGAKTVPKKDGNNINLSLGGQAFFIRILFQQNATYQGEICWVDTQQCIYFRSLLEMIMLLTEAMNEVTTPSQTSLTVRSWKDAASIL